MNTEQSYQPNHQHIDQYAQLRHDMANCLAILQINLAVTKKRNQSTNDSLDAIQHAVDRLGMLMKQWKLFDEEKCDPESDGVETSDFAEIIWHVIDSYKPFIQKKNLRVQFQRPSQQFLMSGHRLQYERLIENLISNACRYTNLGGTIAVKLQHQGTHLRFVVADNGIGIEQDEAHHIFDRYFRSVSAKRFEQTGTGLGLSIVKEAIEALGGKIRVRSQPGIGSTFIVTLPYR